MSYIKIGVNKLTCSFLQGKNKGCMEVFWLCASAVSMDGCALRTVTLFYDWVGGILFF